MFCWICFESKNLFLETSKIFQSLSAEAVARRFSIKKVFLGISQNSLENTCVRVSILIKLQAYGLQTSACKARNVQYSCHIEIFKMICSVKRLLFIWLGHKLLAQFMLLVSFYPLENIRKTEVFWCFHGVCLKTNDMKWVKFSDFLA